MAEDTRSKGATKGVVQYHGYLPPLARLKIPETKTQSAKVRWLAAMGYSVRDISVGTGIKYQQVRNMVTTVPKRAAREDMPPLEVELLDPVDDVQAIMDAELDRSLGAARAGRKTRVVAEEDLDDENYVEQG